jgi:hypothetical protein
MAVKQQHFVPRCYLKNFANHREQIFVIDKDTQKPRAISFLKKRKNGIKMGKVC